MNHFAMGWALDCGRLGLLAFRNIGCSPWVSLLKFNLLKASMNSL